DQEEAMTLADRIAVMRGGRIEQVGSPMEIYANPVNLFVADFFGSPSMNLVAGEIVDQEGAARFRSPRFDLALPPHFAAAKPGGAPLGIRRDPVVARPADGGDAALPVRLIEPLGKDTLLYFDDGTPRAFIAVSEGLDMAEMRPGATIALSFDPARLYLFG